MKLDICAFYNYTDNNNNNNNNALKLIIIIFLLLYFLCRLVLHVWLESKGICLFSWMCRDRWLSPSSNQFRI